MSDRMLVIVQIDRHTGRLLDCWFAGGEHFVVEPPERPFFYDRSFHVRGDEVTRRLLSQPERDINIFKVIVDNVYQVRRERRADSMECGVRFIERLAQDFGFKQNSMKLSLAAFDVEASSSGQFPRPDRDQIRAMSFFSPHIQDCYTDADYPEYEIISKVGDGLERENVDVFATYSGTAFDYTFPVARARELGVDMPWGRLGEVPYTKEREYLSGKKKGVDRTTYMSGRICFDVYKEVRFDPYLSGVRRGLKPVSRFFFGDKYVMELDRTRLKMAASDELYEYCFSDARLCYLLANHYLDMLKPVAMILRVPLDFMINRSPSHIGNIVYGREFNTLGIVSDGANFERFTGVLW